MVGPFFYSDDPIRDAAEYYEWLDYGQEEESEDDERYYPCDNEAGEVSGQEFRKWRKKMNYKKDEAAGWEALGAAVLESAAAEWCDVMSDTYANKNDATERKDAWGGYWQRLLKAAEDEKYIRENAVLGDELADRIKATLAETQLATAPSLRLRKGVRLDRTTKRSTITAVVTMSAPREKEYQLLIDFFEAAIDFFPSFKTEGVEGGEA